jgi:hypothetical protein
MKMLPKFGLLFVLMGAASCQPAGSGDIAHNVHRGWYYAGSRIKDEEAVGGFGNCDNFPKAWARGMQGKERVLSLVAYPEKTVNLGKRHGMPLHLINSTGERVAFAACDSRLYIVREALADDGGWRALEQFPGSRCGNSYHRVFLAPNEYWEFVAPHYTGGSIKAKQRFRLVVDGKRRAQRADGVVLSNEFDAPMDPADFVKDEAHRQ